MELKIVILIQFCLQLQPANANTHGSDNIHHFNVEHNNKLEINAIALSFGASRLECATLCGQIPNCVAINILSLDANRFKCEFLDQQSGSDAMLITASHYTYMYIDVSEDQNHMQLSTDAVTTLGLPSTPPVQTTLDIDTTVGSQTTYGAGTSEESKTTIGVEELTTKQSTQAEDTATNIHGDTTQNVEGPSDITASALHSTISSQTTQDTAIATNIPATQPLTTTIESAEETTTDLESTVPTTLNVDSTVDIETTVYVDSTIPLESTTNKGLTTDVQSTSVLPTTNNVDTTVGIETTLDVESTTFLESTNVMQTTLGVNDATTEQLCPGYVYTYNGGSEVHCYVILDQEQNNNNAVTECVTIGNGRQAALVSIETSEERDNVIDIFNDQSCDSDDEKKFWIGLTEESGAWIWENGEPFDESLWVGYDLDPLPGECTRMTYICGAGSWHINNKHCLMQYMAICEIILE